LRGSDRPGGLLLAYVEGFSHPGMILTSKGSYVQGSRILKLAVLKSIKAGNFKESYSRLFEEVLKLTV
jgi:hypothetical protein